MATKAKAHDTLCWDCEKASGRCSWSKNFTPVPGWKAEPTTDSFDVYECPEFELMKAIKRKAVLGI